MNGNALKEAPICVDCFTGSYNNSKYLHFLSHVHADHIVGLTCDFKYKIFCSQTSAKLIKHKLKITSGIIKELAELCPHVLFHNGVYFTVTLIPANHCPGSVMFLFEFDSKRILYTGDFRYCDGISKIGQSYWGKSVQRITSLYLDNTYCDPQCRFTNRESSIKEIINICKDHDGKNIYIGISWTGHENLLTKLAEMLNETIVVTEPQYNVLKILQLPNVFTINKSEGRIHAVPMHTLTSTFLQQAKQLNENVIAIKPTARLCHNKFENKSDFYYVNYSNHSSFVELIDFVEEVNPQNIYPVVRGKNCIGGLHRADMSMFYSLLNTSEKIGTSHLNNLENNQTEISPKDCLKNVLKIPPRKKTRQKRIKPMGIVFE